MHLPLFHASDEVGQPLPGGHILAHTNSHTTIDGAGAAVLLGNTYRWRLDFSLLFYISTYMRITPDAGDSVPPGI
jgi:hypothetical protein